MPLFGVARTGAENQNIRNIKGVSGYALKSTGFSSLRNPIGFYLGHIDNFVFLRANTCIRVSETIDGVAALKRYYCQLIFLQNRFHTLTMPSC